MASPFKITLAVSSPLRRAVQQVLTAMKVPTEAVAEAEAFSVSPAGESRTYTGIIPMFAVLRKTQEEEASARLLGASAAERALVNQWASLACQIAGSASRIEDAEAVVSERAFLAATNHATAADILFYAAIASDAYASSSRVPSLCKWAAFAEKDELIAPIKVERAAPAAASSSGSSGKAGKGGGAPQVKPSAEEIERRRIEKEKAKAEKAAAAEAAGEAPKKPQPKGKKSAAAVEDASGLDVRVGKILSVAGHPEADKLYVEQIDLAEDSGPRTIVSGLVDHYKAEELNGLSCIVVCNMKPKPLKGVPSNGMVLVASAEGQKMCVVSPPPEAPVGSRVVFGGKATPELPPIPSNTVMAELLAHLRTDSKGGVSWKDHPAAINGTVLTSPVTDGIVK